jgi:hypothetical protein
VAKTITYKIPNERYGTDDSEGKTASVEYNGPDTLVCWVINNEPKTRVVDSFAKEDVPERPTPQNYTAVEIDATASDENALRVALIYGGLPVQMQLEIDNGVAEIPNKHIADPTHVLEVYDKPKAIEDCIDLDTGVWTPLEYRTGDISSRTDEDLRNRRNGHLDASDGKMVADLPADLDAVWTTYRQVLRDLPALTAAVDNTFVTMPTPPNEPAHLDLAESTGHLVRIADRSAAQQAAIDNQTPANIT